MVTVRRRGKFSYNNLPKIEDFRFAFHASRTARRRKRGGLSAGEHRPENKENWDIKRYFVESLSPWWWTRAFSMALVPPGCRARSAGSAQRERERERERERLWNINYILPITHSEWNLSFCRQSEELQNPEWAQQPLRYLMWSFYIVDKYKFSSVSFVR